jgi:DNA-binding transcriptional regulator YiaG
MKRTHIRSDADNAPTALSLDERVKALESAVVTLTRSIGALKMIRDSGNGLPTLPPGSGHALAIARQRARWSNKQLAEAIGVSSSLLSLWETERSAIPQWRADSILEVFNLSEAEPPTWETKQ